MRKPVGTCARWNRARLGVMLPVFASQLPTYQKVHHCIREHLHVVMAQRQKREYSN